MSILPYLNDWDQLRSQKENVHLFVKSVIELNEKPNVKSNWNNYQDSMFVNQALGILQEKVEMEWRHLDYYHLPGLQLVGSRVRRLTQEGHPLVQLIESVAFSLKRKALFPVALPGPVSVVISEYLFPEQFVQLQDFSDFSNLSVVSPRIRQEQAEALKIRDMSDGEIMALIKDVFAEYKPTQGSFDLENPVVRENIEMLRNKLGAFHHYAFRFQIVKLVEEIDQFVDGMEVCKNFSKENRHTFLTSYIHALPETIKCWVMNDRRGIQPEHLLLLAEKAPCLEHLYISWEAVLKSEAYIEPLLDLLRCLPSVSLLLTNVEYLENAPTLHAKELGIWTEIVSRATEHEVKDRWFLKKKSCNEQSLKRFCPDEGERFLSDQDIEDCVYRLVEIYLTLFNYQVNSNMVRKKTQDRLADFFNKASLADQTYLQRILNKEQGIGKNFLQYFLDALPATIKKLKLVDERVGDALMKLLEKNELHLEELWCYLSDRNLIKLVRSRQILSLKKLVVLGKEPPGREAVAEIENASPYLVQTSPGVFEERRVVQREEPSQVQGRGQKRKRGEAQATSKKAKVDGLKPIAKEVSGQKRKHESLQADAPSRADSGLGDDEKKE